MNKAPTLIVITAGAALLALQGCSITSYSSGEPVAAHRWHEGGGVADEGWYLVQPPAAPGSTSSLPPGAAPAPPTAPPLAAPPSPPMPKLPRRPLLPGKDDHAPGLGHALPPEPGQSDKPVAAVPGKGEGTRPGAQACVAARKAAQAGLCEQAWELYASCSGSQAQATAAKLTELCGAG